MLNFNKKQFLLYKIFDTQNFPLYKIPKIKNKK